MVASGMLKDISKMWRFIRCKAPTHIDSDSDDEAKDPSWKYANGERSTAGDARTAIVTPSTAEEETVQGSVCSPSSKSTGDGGSPCSPGSSDLGPAEADTTRCSRQLALLGGARPACASCAEEGRSCSSCLPGAGAGPCIDLEAIRSCHQSVRPMHLMFGTIIFLLLMGFVCLGLSMVLPFVHKPPAPSTHEQEAGLRQADDADGSTYNCDSDAGNWSESQEDWCCSARGLGCPDFDCDAEFDEWALAWSRAKKSWCCRHKDRGCEGAPSPTHPVAPSPGAIFASSAAQPQEQRPDGQGSWTGWLEEAGPMAHSLQKLLPGLPPAAAAAVLAASLAVALALVALACRACCGGAPTRSGPPLLPVGEVEMGTEDASPLLLHSAAQTKMASAQYTGGAFSTTPPAAHSTVAPGSAAATSGVASSSTL